MEQGFPGDRITENSHTLVLGAGAPGKGPATRRGGEGVSSVSVGGRGQRFYSLGISPYRELFILLFLGADHLAGIALYPGIIMIN